MKKRIAIFEYTSGVMLGFQFFSEEHMEANSEVTRISEYVEIDFADLPREEVVSRQVEGINKEIAEARAKHADNISRLEQRRAELLALTEAVSGS